MKLRKLKSLRKEPYLHIETDHSKSIYLCDFTNFRYAKFRSESRP